MTTAVSIPTECGALRPHRTWWWQVRGADPRCTALHRHRRAGRQQGRAAWSLPLICSMAHAARCLHGPACGGRLQRTRLKRHFFRSRTRPPSCSGLPSGLTSGISGQHSAGRHCPEPHRSGGTPAGSGGAITAGAAGAAARNAVLLTQDCCRRLADAFPSRTTRRRQDCKICSVRGKSGTARCAGRAGVCLHSHRVVVCVCRRRHQHADHQRRHRGSRATPPPSPRRNALPTATPSTITVPAHQAHQHGGVSTCRLLETCNVSVS